MALARYHVAIAPTIEAEYKRGDRLPDITSLLLLLSLGAVVGVAAGLLGVGGGAIMVPAFTALFMAQGMPEAQLVHTALGTSMASIIMTSISSLRAHHARQGVRWPVVRALVPGVLAGSFLGALLTPYISGLLLAGFFSLFMLYVAVNMFRSSPVVSSECLPGKLSQLAVGAGIGGISALVSIGGGTLTVPWLVRHGIDIKHAIGTSAAVGLPIALAGTLGYLLSGRELTDLSQLQLGYINLPAVLCVSAVSFFTAPVGVRIAYRLPVPMLKKVFGVLVFSVSLKMFLSLL